MRVGSLFAGYGGADLAVQSVFPDGDRWGVTCPQCRYESDEVTSHAMARVLLQQHQGETV